MMEYEYTFDFTDTGWKTLYPDNYSVVDGSSPFYTASTFTHDGKNALRSGGISDGGTSTTTINFKLLQSGSIEFNYTVSSEGNYDWLTITLDGTQIVRVSGTVSWTVFTKELDIGDHVLELKYTKDGSQSRGSDAGAIGYLKIFGMNAPYEKKYLVSCDETIYTIVDGVLSSLSVTELTADVFHTYGVDVIPTWEQISSLTNPEILLWYDSDEYIPKVVATMTATPYPQTIISPNYDMSNDTILGVECAYVTASSDVVFAISVDDGVTWYMWTGEAWGTLTDTATGMSAETINAITTEQWAGLMTTGQFKVRMTLFDENSSFTSFVMDYIN